MGSKTLPEEFTDDDLLDYTQRMRIEILDTLRDENGKMTTDPGQQSIALHALADMDRQSLSKKKIQSSEISSEADRQVALIIARMGTSTDSGDPFKVVEGETIRGEEPNPDEIVLPEAKLVHDETNVGIQSMNYRDFVNEYESKNSVDGK
ncbi:MAG: hypothetical protein CL678_15800 [Bdellovibrionaceae bacterium]|nr:hypothetical protein [Pseudobdellovibrionaceae bacterium]